MSIYLTDPENPKPHKNEVIFWDHKEDTVQALMELGVPLRPAELTVIDFKAALYIAQRNKLTPEKTAEMLFSVAENAYKRKDGSWAYT